MTRYALALPVAATLLALVACSPSTTPDPAPPNTLAARTHPTPAPLPPGVLAGDPIGTGPVVRVTDGDTIHVTLNGVATDVRIIGLDTPETVKPGYEPACFGAQASANAHHLFDGQTVTLRRDPTQAAKDRYGRTLAYVTEPDGHTDYSIDAVAHGFGRADQVGRAPQEWAALTAAQGTAQSAHAGLWGACGGTFPFPTPKPHPTSSPAPSTSTVHPAADSRAAREPSSLTDTSYRCTNRFDYSRDPRNNATINSIGATTGTCPAPITAAYQDPQQSTNDPWIAGQLAWCRAGHDGIPASQC